MDIKKLKAKVEETLNKDEKADPIVVERINQIFNDAIAGMPPEKPEEVAKEKPEEALVRRLKTQIEAVKSDTSPELAKKLKEVLAAVEPEIKKSAETVPAKPVAPAASTGPIPSAPPKPAAPAAPKT